MNFTEIEIGGQIYKARLTVKSLIALEKKLGRNPVQMFMDASEGTLPTLSDMVTILQAALSTLNHSITLDKTAELVEQYIMDGHNMFDLVPVLVDIFKDSGFVNTDDGEEAEPKN